MKTDTEMEMMDTSVRANVSSLSEISAEEKTAAFPSRSSSSVSRSVLIHEPKVKELMSEQVFTLYEDDTIKFLGDLMKWQRIRHVPVVGVNNQLVGLVTHRDLLRALSQQWEEGEGGADQGDYGLKRSQTDAINTDNGLSWNVPVAKIMRQKVTTVGPEVPLAIAAELMFTQKFGCLPVVENGRLVGIITEADFVRSFYEWEVRFTN